MKVPSTIPVMILPNVTLFPQALLPLYIFEPRYRHMLTDVLNAHRMFAIAMRKPGSKRETPAPIAGLGLVRVALEHGDGTSHLILEGMARITLGKTVAYQPYRVHRIRTLPTPPCDTVATNALLARVCELILERSDLGLPFHVTADIKTDKGDQIPSSLSAREVVGYLHTLNDPAEAADLVSRTVLPGGIERQAILEAADVETRLRRLIQFMMREIRKHQKGSHE